MKKNARTRLLASVVAVIAVCGIVQAQPVAPDGQGQGAEFAPVGNGAGYWGPDPSQTCPYFPTPGGPCYSL